MDKATHEDTEPWFEMHQEEATRTIGWVLDLRRRVLYHHRSLELGADPRDVDIACAGELRRFVDRDRVLGPLRLPSGVFMRALSDVQSDAPSDYFKPQPGTDRITGGRKKGRPRLLARKHLLALAAHLVETLSICGAFGKGEAAEEVASRLNRAGLREPDGGSFPDTTVTDWYERAKHNANHGDLERQMFDRLNAALGKERPEHMQWNRAQCLEWLDIAIREAVSTRYFDRYEPD